MCWEVRYSCILSSHIMNTYRQTGTQDFRKDFRKRESPTGWRGAWKKVTELSQREGPWRSSPAHRICSPFINTWELFIIRYSVYKAKFFMEGKRPLSQSTIVTRQIYTSFVQTRCAQIDKFTQTYAFKARGCISIQIYKHEHRTYTST